MKIVKINDLDLHISCLKIENYIEKVNPDWIIPICSGGEMVRLYSLNFFSNYKIHKVCIRHKENKFLKKLVRYLPEFITDLMRKLDCIRPKSDFREIQIGDIDKVQGKVVILDDAIDTGRTIRILKSYLEGRYIKTVVINNIRGSKLSDFSLYDNVLIKFPWNNDYKV